MNLDSGIASDVELPITRRCSFRQSVSPMFGLPIKEILRTEGAPCLFKRSARTKRIVAGILLTQADLLPESYMHGQVERASRIGC